MARFERLNWNPREWDQVLGNFPDRIVFQTSAWLSFLAETQNGEVVVAALKEGDQILGYFSGVIINKFGFKILGSPFRGWSTPYLGFNLKPGVSRQIAAAALPEFAFKQLRCIHFEITDSHTTDQDLAGLAVAKNLHATIEVDLTQSEETLLKNMTSTCRRNIRHAEKAGVRIEETGDESFADEYTTQYRDVLAKQGLVPHFGAERIRSMIRHVHPTGMLLLLRARNPEGQCIATGIYPAANRTAFYNNGASWRQYQGLRPNELLHWYAMRYWKQRGMESYNMEGTMDFKQKFGGQQTQTTMFYQSRFRMLTRLRSSALPIGRALLGLAWKIKGGKGRKPAPNQGEAQE
jgi:hypothetical protein